MTLAPGQHQPLDEQRQWLAAGTAPRPTVRALPPFPEFCGDVLGLDLSTRQGHVAIAKAVDGLALTADEPALFTSYTGLESPRRGGYDYILELFGRQSGKTEQAAARLVYAAVKAVLAGQRDVACVGMSQDHRAAQRVLFTYVERFFERPLLQGLVVSKTQDTIVLQGNVKIMVLPCRPQAIRGLRCVLVVLDEVCHFRSSENVPLDRDAWRAALPTLLTTNGKIIALSSPVGSVGLAYELHRTHYGHDSDVLIVQGPSIAFNPTLTTKALDQIRMVDPEGAEAELEGQFLANVTALIDEAALVAAVDHGVTVRPPVSGREYAAAVDTATGMKSGRDRWAAAIAHSDNGIGVLDALLLIKPPFSPTTAAEQTAALCKTYGVREIFSDRFAAGFSDDIFARTGVTLKPSERSTSDYHLDFAGAVNSGLVRLLDHAELLKEYRGLERRRGPVKDRADHRRGSHDDAAAAVSAVLTQVRQPKKATFAFIPVANPVMGAGPARARGETLEAWSARTAREHQRAWQREYFR